MAEREPNPEIYLRKVRENIAKKQGYLGYEAVARERAQAAVDRAEAEFLTVSEVETKGER